jgi:hypothetical protein
LIAALFVETDGCYFGIEDVDPWDKARVARRYDGPYPVVAHPPCERWGRYWSGGPSAKVRRKLGDDGGCFASALESVRRWGGVLEHPEASQAWRVHGLIPPMRGGGWSVAGDGHAWTCCVEQGSYGHRARKATWLYAVRCQLPVLRWRARGTFLRLDEGFHSSESARQQRAARIANQEKARERIKDKERAATPIEFRDLLLDLARSVTP